MVALDDVDRTLARGTGTCLQKIAVFVALCRAAGIPARFKFCALARLDDIFAASLQNAPLVKKWFDAMGNFLLHGEGEAFIDGEWVTADISSRPAVAGGGRSARSPASGRPRSGCGSFPSRDRSSSANRCRLGMRNLSSRMLFDSSWPAPSPASTWGSWNRSRRGRKVIEAAGGEEAYDAEARRRHRPVASRADLLRDHEAIRFTKK